MAGDQDKEKSPETPLSKTDITHPFFLGIGDRPGDFITPTRLRSDNYDDWASDVQLALEACRKYGFVDGSITNPISPYTASVWTTVNAMIVSWLLNTIDVEVKGTLSKFRKAHQLWTHLKTRFATINALECTN